MTEPTSSTPKPSVYDALGGEAAVRALVRRFYELMDSLPEAAAARRVHPESLERAREKLFEYLTGWLGGPPLYTSKYGHPRLRQRHLHAAIGREEIEAWLLCFHRAWEEVVAPSALAAEVLVHIDSLAWHMGNRPPQPAPAAPVG